MAISMFSSQHLPIAIDFGTSSVKMLQLTAEDPPSLIAAAEIMIPDAARNDLNERMQFLGEQVAGLLRKLRFKGKRATFSIPSLHTFVQHVEVPTSGPVVGEEFIRQHLQMQLGYLPSNLVIRTAEVAEVVRDATTRKETICFAVPKDIVMRHIDILNRCKLEVVGVHTEQQALVWSFSHINRRESDASMATLVVDIGWASTKVAISHGRTLMFSKSIAIGGQHFDRAMSEAAKCDNATARAMRRATADECIRNVRASGAAAVTNERHLAAAAIKAAAAMSNENQPKTTTVITEDRRQGLLPATLRPAGANGNESPATPGDEELIEVLGDELAMCLRYHRTHFSGVEVDRLIFVGGESNHAGMCRRIAERLDLSAMLGDPMARVRGLTAGAMEGIRPDSSLPGWAVAHGLCVGGEHS